MRKLKIHPLAVVTLFFVLFTAGFFAGRNYNHSDVQITPRAFAASSPSETEASGETYMAEDGLININTATAAQLQTLPGIGEVLARRIIDYREANGPFTKTTDLIRVEGIGEKKLTSILELITVQEVTQ